MPKYLYYLLLIIITLFCSCSNSSETLTNPPANLNLTGIWRDADSTMQIDIVHNLQTNTVSGNCDFLVWGSWKGSGPVNGSYSRPKLNFNVEGTGIGINYQGMISDDGNSMDGTLLFSKGTKNVKLIRRNWYNYELWVMNWELVIRKLCHQIIKKFPLLVCLYLF